MPPGPPVAMPLVPVVDAVAIVAAPSTDNRYRIAIGNARAAHEHTTEGPGRRKRRNHIAVRIGRFNHAAIRTARLYESKRLRTAREALRHAHSARHEHRTARNRRFTVVVECPIAVARGAIHQKRSAVDFNIAVGINAIALGIKHNRTAIDLDETIRIACTRCATLPARGLATALHNALGIGGMTKVARSLTRLATFAVEAIFDGTHVD